MVIGKIQQMFNDYRSNVRLMVQLEPEIARAKKCALRAPNAFNPIVAKLQHEYDSAQKIVDDIAPQLDDIIDNVPIPARERLVLTYFYICGYDIYDCADKMDIEIRQAFNLKQRAFRIIHKYLDR